MLVLLKALIVGIITGIIFAVFKLPIPAPITIAGLLGIIGIYLGYIFINSFKQ